jgi:hypothetical protein
MLLASKPKKCYLCGAKEDLRVFPSLYVKGAYICKKGCNQKEKSPEHSSESQIG